MTLYFLIQKTKVFSYRKMKCQRHYFRCYSILEDISLAAHLLCKMKKSNLTQTFSSVFLHSPYKISNCLYSIYSKKFVRFFFCWASVRQCSSVSTWNVTGTLWENIQTVKPHQTRHFSDVNEIARLESFR